MLRLISLTCLRKYTIQLIGSPIKVKKSLMGDFMSGGELVAYWNVQRDLHKVILKASGAIK